MSFVLVVVIVTGLAIGYWLVGALLSSGEPPADRPAEPGPAGGDAEDGRTARHWSAVLDVPIDADATRITAAYRRAIARYTPADAADMAPDIRALAGQRMAEIEAAYAEAMRALQR